MVKAMFERFDKNGDGQIDAAERPDLRGFIKDQGWLPGGLNNSF
jgi:Ca2+-binding EF-hand superfamily protein